MPTKGNPVFGAAVLKLTHTVFGRNPQIGFAEARRCDRRFGNPVRDQIVADRSGTPQRQPLVIAVATRTIGVAVELDHREAATAQHLDSGIERRCRFDADRVAVPVEEDNERRPVAG